MRYFHRFFFPLFLLLSVSTLTFTGCRTSEVGNEQVRELEKVENQEQKAYQKEYEQAVKKHQKMQSESTKQMMKQSKKQQKKLNKDRQRSLWDRIFRRKCNTGPGKG
ncbi:MAG: hypothetical protein L3J66_04805 [Bacteroidales bacterium]|nr:hypothetical protein [Bacteroidales bacterium]